MFELSFAKLPIHRDDWCGFNVQADGVLFPFILRVIDEYSNPELGKSCG